MNLDELLPDDAAIFLHHGVDKMPTALTGKDLKAAIREEIANMIKEALDPDVIAKRYVDKYFT